MKKIILFFLMSLCLACVGCSEKQVPAEITLTDENQQEISYQIKKTDSAEEVKEVFKNLNNAKIDNNFSGFSLSFQTDLEGKVTITNQETRIITLGYSIDMNVMANLKKYRMNGSFLLEGYTNTDSDSLSLNVKNKLLLDIQNDDTYLYLKGNLEEGNDSLSIKNKMNIEEITAKYKAIITSYIDLMKYYRLSDLYPEYMEWVDMYHITISKTSKDSFTLRLLIPASLIFNTLDSTLNLDIEVGISCKTLLPIEFQFQADEILSLLLEDEYIEKYLSSTIEVNKAKLKVFAKIKYDTYKIEEMAEEEKENYKEYFIKNID